MHKNDEIAFAKQLNEFEASIDKDLKTRSSEVAKKWEFDFSLETPALCKNLSWE